MTHKNYMMVSKTIFTIIAFVHLLRIIFGWTIVLNGWSAPIWVSWIGVFVAGYLAYSAKNASR
jgi:hypothetical protein